MQNVAILTATCFGISLLLVQPGAFAKDNTSSTATKCKDGKTVNVSVTGKNASCSKAKNGDYVEIFCSTDDDKTSGGGCDKDGNANCDDKQDGTCTITRVKATTASVPGGKVEGFKQTDSKTKAPRASGLLRPGLLEGGSDVTTSGPAATGRSAPPAGRLY